VNGLYARPEIRAFLHAAKEQPEEDLPRLALADWLDERDDADRAAFIRLSCRLGPGTQPPLSPEEKSKAPKRLDALHAQFGGAWLGSSWRHGGVWHRGLLSTDLDREARPEALTDMLPWIDTLWFDVTGREALRSAASVLNAVEVNHVGFHLLRPFKEDNLLALLAEVRESRCLRTVTFRWSPGMGAGQLGKPMLGLTTCFFDRLLGEFPIGQHLTHFGSGLPLAPEHAERLRVAGVVPVPAWPPQWMHGLPPTGFRR
jgi:uncharacterized protein (TIGR02996 family)